MSLTCIIYSDPLMHCLMFCIVLGLAKVKLEGLPQKIYNF